MLTVEEIQMLESLLRRARLAISAALKELPNDAIAPGDLVQLRPGADPQWETSFLSVAKIRDDGGISGTILRPHRGGWRDAWFTYRPPEVLRIGRAPFPEPTLRVQSAGYWPPCPSCHNLERKPVGRETRQAAKVAK
jgi:hypothetical protein